MGTKSLKLKSRAALDPPLAQRSAPKSKAAKAGLIFPVSRINAKLKARKTGNMRIGGGAPIFVTALAQSICGEILEAACKELIGSGRKRIQPIDVIAAIRRDPEIAKAVGGVRILVGEKFTANEISDEILTKEQKNAREAAKAARIEAEGEGEEDDAEE